MTCVGPEIPLFFETGDEVLLGLVGAPTQCSRETVVVIASGGWTGNSAGRNGIFARLCRELNDDGFHTFRFDYHGAGDSTGSVSRFRLTEPFTKDLEGAIAAMTSLPVKGTMLVGFCFGARTVLAAAEAIDRLAGVVLLSAPLVESGQNWRTRPSDLSIDRVARTGLRRDTWRQLRDNQARRAYRDIARRYARYQWRRAVKMMTRSSDPPEETTHVSEHVTRQLDGLIQRAVPTLFLYGDRDPEWEDFDAASSSDFGELLRRASGIVDVSVLPGDVHNLSSIAVQDNICRRIRSWITSNDSQ